MTPRERESEIEDAVDIWFFGIMGAGIGTVIGFLFGLLVGLFI